MKKLLSVFKSFVRDEKGLETVEYAIILGLIVAGTVGVIAAIGIWVNGQFVTVQGELMA
jgi:Flp pilus assembly pilin Flp